MDDFKNVAVELFKLVLEEHAFLGIAKMTGSKDMVKQFMDTSLKVTEFMVEHDSDFQKALLEVKDNEMLNDEVE